MGKKRQFDESVNGKIPDRRMTDAEWETVKQVPRVYARYQELWKQEEKRAKMSKLSEASARGKAASKALGSDHNRALVLADLANRSGRSVAAGTLPGGTGTKSIALTLKGKYNLRIEGNAEALDDAAFELMQKEAVWQEYLGNARARGRAACKALGSDHNKAVVLAELANRNGHGVAAGTLPGGTGTKNIASTLKDKYNRRIEGHAEALDDAAFELMQKEAVWQKYLGGLRGRAA